MSIADITGQARERWPSPAGVPEAPLDNYVHRSGLCCAVLKSSGLLGQPLLRTLMGALHAFAPDQHRPLFHPTDHCTLVIIVLLSNYALRNKNCYLYVVYGLVSEATIYTDDSVERHLLG